jgi:hypothetical protein
MRTAAVMSGAFSFFASMLERFRDRVDEVSCTSPRMSDLPGAALYARGGAWLRAPTRARAIGCPARRAR